MCELRGIDDALPRSNRAPDIGEGHVRRTGWGGDHGAFGTVNQLETADEVSRSGLTVALAVFALAISPASTETCLHRRTGSPVGGGMLSGTRTPHLRRWQTSVCPFAQNCDLSASLSSKQSLPSGTMASMTVSDRLSLSVLGRTRPMSRPLFGRHPRFHLHTLSHYRLAQTVAAIEAIAMALRKP